MANENYLVRGTPVVFTQNGASYRINLNGALDDSLTGGSSYPVPITNSAGPDLFEYVIEIDGVVNGGAMADWNNVSLFISQSSDNSNWDGSPTTNPNHSPVTLGVWGNSNVRRNLLFAGSASSRSSTHADKWQKRGRFRATGLYISPLIYSQAGNTLTSTGNHQITITPLWYQGQT